MTEQSRHAGANIKLSTSFMVDATSMQTMKSTPKSILAFTIKEDRPILIVGLILTALAGACKPTIAIFLGKVFDELTNAALAASRGETYNLLPKVTVWVLALTSLAAGTWVVNSIFFTLWLLFGERQARTARQNLFVGLLAKDQEWYELRSDGVASLLVRIQTQVRELKTATSQPLGFFVEDVAAGFVALCISFVYSWRLTFVISASTPILMGLTSLATRKLETAVETQKMRLSQASKASYSAFSSINTVKAYNSQNLEALKFQTIIKKAAVAYLTQARGNAISMGLIRFGSILMFVQAFWFGLTLVDGGINAGSIVTCFYSVLIAVESVEALMPQWLVLTKGMSAGETLKHVVSLIINGKTIKQMQGSWRPDKCDGDIEVVNLSFAYPSAPEQLVLDSASFLFPAGETTFVIGKSGSGKSTLGNLLMRYYEPRGGDVLVDNHPIVTLDLDWLRNTITLVQQQSVLFDETLFRNIAFGRRQHSQITQEEVMLACRTAMLEETIHNLPQGLGTNLGAGGNELSGGQKQRVSIARARIKDSAILILDEATSALDPTSRLLVMDAVREWRTSKTTIVITHDISQIRPNDFLYILEHGKIVQEGFREALEKERSGAFMSFLPSHVLKENETIMDVPESATSVLGTFWESELTRAMAPSNRGFARFSQYLGQVDNPARSSSVNWRMSRGVGPMRLNELRTEKAWRVAAVDGTQPVVGEATRNRSTSRAQRPSSHMYSTRGRKHSILPDELELIKLMGDSSVESRQGTPRLNRNNEFERNQPSSSNVVPYFTVDEDLDIKLNKKGKDIVLKDFSLVEILHTVWPNLQWHDRAYLILGLVSAIINGGATPAFSYALAQLLNVYYATENRSALSLKWALVTVGIAFIDGLSSFAFHYLLERSGQLWVDNMRITVLNKILCQPRAWFDKPEYNAARLSETLDHNCEEMRNLLGRFVGYLLVAFTMIIIATIWAITVSWRLTLVAFAAAPVMLLCSELFSRVASRWDTAAESKAQDISAIFTETFSNIRTVRALQLESWFQDKHSNAVKLAYAIGQKRALYEGVCFGLSDSTNTFVTALILYMGSYFYAQGSISLQEILLTMTLLLFSFGNASMSMGFIPQISQSMQTATFMINLSRLPSRPPFEYGGQRRLVSPFPVRCNGLNFTYPSRPAAKVLNGLSLKIEAGSCTAIVGASGSGKSTIATLMLALYPPSIPLTSTMPTLTYGGVSIFDLHIPSLRNLIAIVPQTAVLFPASIHDNITYGLPEISPYHSHVNVVRAAREAGIHEYIMSLPRAYQTEIGDGGQGLSGGQAQRICIARALVRRPKILILDEATSALDVESAEIIRQTIINLIKNARPSPLQASGLAGFKFGLVQSFAEKPFTIDEDEGRGLAVVLITHSIDMIRIAERIVMLEKGRVAEEGNWNELARSGGAFERLISAGECE